VAERFEFSQITKKRIKAVLLFGLPVGVSAIIGKFSSNIDKLVIGNFYDSQTFAVFSNGAYEIPFLAIIGGSLFNVLIPSLKKEFENKSKERVLKLWKKAGLSMISIIVPIAATFVVFAKPSVLFLFSEKYIEAVPYFRLYQIRLFFRIFLYGSFFIAAGKSKLYMYNAAISMIMNLILDIVLVSLIGPIGAVLATLLSVLILVLLQLTQISRILSVSIKEVYPWKKWSISIVIALFISTILYLLSSLISSNIILWLFFMGISFIINFFVLSKFIDSQILDYLLSFIKRG